MCGTGGTNDHGAPFVRFTGAAFEIRGAGGAQKGDFDRIKRVHVESPSSEFKNTRKQKSKRKKGLRSARPYVSAEQIQLLFASLLCYNYVWSP